MAGSTVGTVVRLGVLVAALLSIAAGASWAGDLLHGIRIEPEADVSYSRSRDYGGWRTKACMSTRMIVRAGELDHVRCDNQHLLFSINGCSISERLHCNRFDRLHDRRLRLVLYVQHSLHFVIQLGAEISGPATLHQPSILG